MPFLGGKVEHDGQMGGFHGERRTRGCYLSRCRRLPLLWQALLSVSPHYGQIGVSVTSAGDEHPFGVGRHDVYTDAVPPCEFFPLPMDGAHLHLPSITTTMLSSPASPPPLPIVYDSDSDMNVDDEHTPNNRLYSHHDVDADGESVDEDSALDNPNHPSHRIPTSRRDSVCLSLLSSQGLLTLPLGC